MVWPGNQALYTSFDFLFNAVEKSSLKLNLKELDYKLDSRFNMATIIGSGEECRLTMMAFFRPEAVNYSLEAIKNEIAVDDSLVGKTILVLGASRGFGSVLSRAFLLKGATVAINYRTDGNEINDLREQLSHFNDSLFFFKGDISRQTDCNQILAEVKHHLGKLDYLVCNASPQIMAYPFQERDTEAFIDFVSRSLSICHRPLLALLPQLNEGATVINISSIYASQPTKQFSHYITAKWALEGMTHALASEFPSLNFVVARLPRMLTDQTNSNFDFEKKVSAISVASHLLDKMLHAEINERPLIINF